MFKILLVCDEKNKRTDIRFLIDKSHLPLSIVEASNGKAALEYIMAHPIDILFTDVKMPLMDGLKLAKVVQAHDESVRIIIFSAGRPRAQKGSAASWTKHRICSGFCPA